MRSLGIGTLFALPLALVNNLYFYLQDGGPRFQNVLLSAFEALSPGIHEEAVYRYFVLAICLALLKDSPHRRWVWTTAIALAVIPHSLLHLPDLFLQNPAMGVVMLVATPLLFGLPMALLQVKRSSSRPSPSTGSSISPGLCSGIESSAWAGLVDGYALCYWRRLYGSSSSGTIGVDAGVADDGDGKGGHPHLPQNRTQSLTPGRSS